MALEIRLDGVWLSTLAPWGALKVTSRWGDGGSGTWEVAFSLSVPPGFRHQAIRRGALVEVVDSGFVVESGILSEPDRSSWNLVASGLCRQAAGFQCLNSSNEPTSVLNVAVDQAIARGLPWTRPTSLRSSKYAETNQTDNLNDLAVLLDGVADLQGQRWGVTPTGAVFLAADPTTPDLLLAPGVDALGAADDEYASALIVRYRDDVTHAYETIVVTDPAAIDAWDYTERPADLTGLGEISSADATAVGQSILNKGSARLDWVGDITATRGQVLSTGGGAVDPSTVRAGQMIRIPVPFDDQRNLTGVTHLDLVIGQAVYEEGSDAVTISPLGSTARTFAAVIEDALSTNRPKFRK